MTDNRKAFEHIVFEVFKDEDAYDKTHHQLMRCYDIMMQKVKKFKTMPLATQYDICSVACLMAMGSSMRALRTIEILTRNKPVRDIERDYCPEYGFNEPNILPINQRKLLTK